MARTAGRSEGYCCLHRAKGPGMSRVLTRSAAAAALMASLLTAGPAWAWGRAGHRIVGSVASEVVEDGRLFWSSNERAIGEFSNTPDTAWKSGPSAAQEKPTHWFQFDFYSPQGATLPAFFRIYAEVLKHYSEATVTENGTATWRVQQFYLDALKGLRSSRYMEAVQLAGAMSHYVGDLSQPLHVTVNYDGQLTNQKGIHKFFETDNLEVVSYDELRDEVARRAQKLMSDSEFRATFEQDLMHAMFMASRRSLTDLPRVLQIDKKQGRTGAAADEQREIAINRMADGAATYAMILSRLWRDGGQVDSDREVTPKEPKWLAPDYSQTAEGSGNAGNGRRRQVDFAPSAASAGARPAAGHVFAGSSSFVDCE